MNTRISMEARQLREFLQLDERLREIILDDALELWPGPELYVTRIHSTEEENEALGARTQIHVVGPPFRALDSRIRNLGRGYQERAEVFAREINERWIYDPDRPNLRVASAAVHGTGPHVHWQVHGNTIRRGRGS